LSVATARVQLGWISQGGRHVTTRQMIGPTHAMWLLQLPYRKRVQHALRLPHEPFPHRQPHDAQDDEHNPLPPHEQPLQLALQSM
jgi:hypothetical protein